MAILENNSDYSAGDQLTPANLNALTEAAKFVKAGAGVASTGNATDESSCNINSSGEIEVKDLGVSTAKLAASAVENAKLDPTTGGAAVAGSAASGSHVNVIQAASIDTADLAADCITEAKIADNAVESEHFNNNVISGQTELTAAPADADELLISDSDVIKKIGVDTFLKHVAIPKAFGSVNFDTAAPSATDGYNVSSITDTSSTVRTVELTNAMSGTEYTVILSVGGSGLSASDRTPYYEITDADTFKILHATGEAANTYISFAVFGTLA